ncbi:MAG: hypothetical protein ACJ756_07650 [Solirubrobacterales bacterium]|jgi:hypothetical protein
MVESVWWPRLRWRMRGAWQWPAFGVLTVADAVLIARLPFQADGPDALGAVLLAGFFNLLAVGVAAPLLGLLVRRRRRDLPWVVARDYAGTLLLGLVTAGLVAGGVAHRGAVRAERADRAAMAVSVHDYVVSQAPRFEAGLASPDIVRLEADHYRTCIYGPEPRPLCLFVNTDQRPAGVRRDPSREPNTTQLRR